MRRAVDEAKRRLWRERLARFARSGQTVAAFCSAERCVGADVLPVEAEAGGGIVSRRRRRAATSSSVTRVRSSSSVNRWPGPCRESPRGAFLPVRIEGATLVEIELPNGARVRVPAGRTGRDWERRLRRRGGSPPGSRRRRRDAEPARRTNVYLCARPVDLRKSFDGLSALVEVVFQRNVLEGHLFLFINKRRDRLKALWWERGRSGDLVQAAGTRLLRAAA